MAARQTEFGASNIFQLVSDPSEKMRILYDLLKSGQRLSVKTPERHDEFLELEPRQIQGSSLLCRPDDKTTVYRKDGELIAQFQVGGQKYICSVPYEKNGELLSLAMEKKLFRVQRREFFRLQLPSGFRGTLSIPELHGVPFNQSFHLVDLSGGGCKIQMPRLDIGLKSGTVFRGIMKLPGRQDFALLCTVRHQNKLPNRKDNLWYGIEFHHANEQDRNRMAAIVMDLYRELFSRL